jgi:hypothetical protein
VNLCSTLGTRTASVIPVLEEALQSVAWADRNETVERLEWAQSRARLPIITENGLRNITLVGSVVYRPLTLLNFQELVVLPTGTELPALGWRLWGDCGTITYGRYRPSIRFLGAASYFGPEWKVFSTRSS